MHRLPVTSAGVTGMTEKLAHRRPSPQPCAERTRCPTSTEPGRSRSGASRQAGRGGAGMRGRRPAASSAVPGAEWRHQTFGPTPELRPLSAKGRQTGRSV